MPQCGSCCFVVRLQLITVRSDLDAELCVFCVDAAFCQKPVRSVRLLFLFCADPICILCGSYGADFFYMSFIADSLFHVVAAFYRKLVRSVRLLLKLCADPVCKWCGSRRADFCAQNLVKVCFVIFFPSVFNHRCLDCLHLWLSEPPEDGL